MTLEASNIRRTRHTPLSEGSESRFRDLLGPDWTLLPAAVRARFSKPLTPGALRIFKGSVTFTRLTLAGRFLARLARVVGSPLPDRDGAVGPALVTVVEDNAMGGQIWTRTYARPGQFPQTINSVKTFSGPTGLEEHLGYGLVMRLVLVVEGGALVFRSSGYDFVFGAWRIPIPRLVWPGVCTITHRDMGDGAFTFSLSLEHPLFGRMIQQIAMFEEISDIRDEPLHHDIPPFTNPQHLEAGAIAG